MLIFIFPAFNLSVYQKTTKQASLFWPSLTTNSPESTYRTRPS